MWTLIVNGSRLQSLLPYFYWVSGSVLLAGLLCLLCGAWRLWSSNRLSSALRYAILVRRFPAWRHELSSVLSRTPAERAAAHNQSLCADCIYHLHGVDGIVLCTANQKDVFPPTQPITQCDAHATWFDARKRMLASSSMVMTTFVICMAMIGATWLQTRQQDNLVELSDLYVSSRDSDQSFSGWAQDKRTLTWVPYSADICPTMTLTDEVQPGVIIAWTGYRPDYVHHCWDISGGRDFGITLYRHKGAHHDPIITPDPRQTTGASLWSPAPTP